MEPPALESGLLDRVRGALADGGHAATPSRVAQALRDDRRVLGDATVLAVTDELRAEITGAGPLEPLLHLPDVTDVVVNGGRGVWLDRGSGLEPAPVQLSGEAGVRRLAVRLAAAAGRRLDDAQPWVDARLPDGTRLHAVLAPLAPDGTCISLRLPPRRVFRTAELVSSGALHPEVDRLLGRLVAARRSFLVTGGTGSGKTTILATLLSLVPARERIVLVEDSAELRPEHPHVVRLQARPANVEGSGGVTMRDLVRQALRMRPDRLVVGEVRGGEVVELLAALNTGHEGGCGTVHANDPAAVPARFEALGSAAGLNRAAVHSQLAVGVDVVVHLARDQSGRRRVASLGVLEADAAGFVAVHPAVLVDPCGRLRRGPGEAGLTRILDGRDV